MKFISTFFVFALWANGALAQTVGPLNLNVGEDLLAPERIFQLITIITILSLAPSVLMMVTSFTRIVIVFSFLRSALGLQTTPPNTVLVSLALFLTAFIMAPTLQQAYSTGVAPYLEGEINEEVAFERSVAPFRTFMQNQVNEKDLRLFLDLMPEDTSPQPAFAILGEDEAPEVVPLQALIPAFMISELRRAFEIGFLIFLPFLVIDLAVASLLMSMGMMMLPPVMIALPFKVIFFVLVDGWHLLTSALIQSFN